MANVNNNNDNNNPSGGGPSTEVVIDSEGNRRYPCGWCHKFFSTNSLRRRHEIAHSNVFPYVCQYCGQGFKRREAQKTHEFQHLYPKETKVTPLRTPKRKTAKFKSSQPKTPQTPQRTLPSRQCKQQQPAYVEVLSSDDENSPSFVSRSGSASPDISLPPLRRLSEGNTTIPDGQPQSQSIMSNCGPPVNNVPPPDNVRRPLPAPGEFNPSEIVTRTKFYTYSDAPRSAETTAMHLREGPPALAQRPPSSARQHGPPSYGAHRYHPYGSAPPESMMWPGVCPPPTHPAVPPLPPPPPPHTAYYPPYSQWYNPSYNQPYNQPHNQAPPLIPYNQVAPPYYDDINMTKVPSPQVPSSTFPTQAFGPTGSSKPPQTGMNYAPSTMVRSSSVVAFSPPRIPGPHDMAALPGPQQTAFPDLSTAPSPPKQIQKHMSPQAVKNAILPKVSSAGPWSDYTCCHPDTPRRTSIETVSEHLPELPPIAPSSTVVANSMSQATSNNNFSYSPRNGSARGQNTAAQPAVPPNAEAGSATGFQGVPLNGPFCAPAVRIQWANRPAEVGEPTRSASAAPVPMSTSTFNALTQPSADKDNNLPGPEFYEWINALLSLPVAQGTPSGANAGDRVPTPAFPCTEDATACVRLCMWLEVGTGLNLKLADGEKYNAAEWARGLSSARFTRCLTAYWDCIDVEWPILHRPSFMPTAESELLLYSIVIAGASYSDDEEDRVWAEGSFPSARGLAMAADAYDRDSLLPVLQCQLLLSIAGQAMGRKQQRAGHALIGAALVLARRESLYEGKRTAPPECNYCDIPTSWAQWIKEESLKRVAWAILVRDIGYASFFSELPSRAMSPFHLPVELPCSDECWEAITAELWKARKPENWEGKHTTGPTLAKVLENDLGGVANKTKRISPFAKLILMYAFIALGWDTNRRDMIASEVFKSPGGVAGLNQFLLQRFASATLHEGGQSSLSRTSQCLDDTIGDISLLAFLDLHIQLMRLRVFVGSTDAGQFRPWGPGEHLEMCEQVYSWLPSQTASTCVELSAKYLAKVIRVNRIRTLSRAWAVYHAFLMCWIAYWSQKAPRNKTHRVHLKDDALQGCEMLVAWARGSPLPLWTNIRALAIEAVRLLSSRREPVSG